MLGDKKVKLDCLKVEIELLEGRLTKAYIDKAYLQGKMDQLHKDNDKLSLPFMHGSDDERTILSEMDAADSVIESVSKDLAARKLELNDLLEGKEEVNVYKLFTDLYNKACLKTASAEELLDEAYEVLSLMEKAKETDKNSLLETRISMVRGIIDGLSTQVNRTRRG